MVDGNIAGFVATAKAQQGDSPSGTRAHSWRHDNLNTQALRPM